jgi:hypothetical protein
MFRKSQLHSKETTLGHLFVNRRSVDKLGWPPGLSTSHPLTNLAASPLLAQTPRTHGNIHDLCLGAESAAEFVYRPLVDTPVAECRLFGNERCLASITAKMPPSRQTRQRKFIRSCSWAGESASLLVWGHIGRNACQQPAHLQTSNARPPACQQRVR